MDNETVISFLTQVKNMIISSPSWTDNAKKHADEAFYKAIKALQQQPVLDKVRAEIENLPIAFMRAGEIQKGALKIIDKYKAESEGENKKEKHTCISCRFYRYDRRTWPCDDCLDYDRWKEVEE